MLVPWLGSHLNPQVNRYYVLVVLLCFLKLCTVCMCILTFELQFFNIFSYTISARLGNALGMIGVSGGVAATLGQVSTTMVRKVSSLLKFF